MWGPDSPNLQACASRPLGDEPARTRRADGVAAQAGFRKLSGRFSRGYVPGTLRNGKGDIDTSVRVHPLQPGDHHPVQLLIKHGAAGGGDGGQGMSKAGRTGGLRVEPFSPASGGGSFHRQGSTYRQVGQRWAPGWAEGQIRAWAASAAAHFDPPRVGRPAACRYPCSTGCV